MLRHLSVGGSIREYRSKAQQDISDAIQWYQKKDKNLAKQLLSNLHNSFNIILENPNLFQKRHNEIRIISTEIFPYTIYFTVEKDIVFVHAILHNRMNQRKGIARV